jgi:pimeloyl-ACP methyl ester carboxylesterase
MNPVLLVHGFATSAARTWGETGMVDLLRDAGREVLAPDLLGHGDAAKPHDPAAYAGLAVELPPGVDQVDAVGFSLGAQVLLAMAAASPSRFGRLVVAGVGANVFSDDQASGEAVARAIEGAAAEGDVTALHFAQLAHAPGNDPAALAACMRRPRSALTPAGLAAVTCPVLVVLGDRDFAGPAGPLVEALPDARLQGLRGVDHFATPKDFGFIDATLRFLDEGRDGTARGRT